MRKFIVSLIMCAACLSGAVFCADAVEQGHLQQKNNDFQLMDALVLGVVEGVTEYLPVSSTGHLLLAQHAMGLASSETDKRAADAYAIIIQIGAILAVTGFYRRRIGQMILGLMGHNARGLRLFLMLMTAFLPAAAFGLALGDVIKARLFGPWPIVAGWLAGGIAILVKPWKNPGGQDAGLSSIDDIGWRQSLLIGAFQIFALWPGVSRSLATIMGGMAAGLGITAALEFSFLLGLITLGAATAYEMVRSGGEVIGAYGIASPLAGILCSFASAWISVRWLLSFVRSRGLVLFGYYRVLLAVITSALLFAGIL